MSIRTTVNTLLVTLAVIFSGQILAATPETLDGVTTIHLDQYNGYFSSKETLAGLKPGKYRIVIKNKAKKLVGFLLQDGVTHEKIDMFPLEPGESRTVTANFSENGFRYRCPINPTPWYDVGVSK